MCRFGAVGWESGDVKVWIEVFNIGLWSGIVGWDGHGGQLGFEGNGRTDAKLKL
jgi:hypothetical protein